MLPAMIGPTPVDTADTEVVIGPPVRIIRPASSLKVNLSSGLRAQAKTPSAKDTSSSCTSQIAAARAAICRLTSSAAWIAARPVSKAVRLPPVTAV